MRLFIAAPLSEDILAKLAVEQDLIRKSGIRASFPRISNLHLTLKFLGDVESFKVPEMREIIDRRLLPFQSFDLRIMGMGVFPSLSSPRVAWAGVELNESLRSVHLVIESALEEIGFPRDNRGFHPHLTLARIKSLSDPRRFAGLIRERKDFEAGTTRVSSICLYQSILNPSGAEYRVLEKFSAEAGEKD